MEFRKIANSMGNWIVMLIFLQLIILRRLSLRTVMMLGVRFLSFASVLCANAVQSAQSNAIVQELIKSLTQLWRGFCRLVITIIGFWNYFLSFAWGISLQIGQRVSCCSNWKWWQQQQQWCGDWERGWTFWIRHLWIIL